MRKFIEEIIKKAGLYLLENFKKEKNLLKIRETSKEVVTKYDKKADELIVKEIKKKFKTHQILTEESGYLKGESSYFWIVDSLDGSGNFANFNPFFCVSISLLFKNELKFGAIFAPALNEFYFAQKGKGAFLNGKRIYVSDNKNLKRAYLVYCEGNEKNKERLTKIISQIYPKVKDMRKIGSAGIELAFVASGRADIYFTTQIDPWDVAGGILLVKEAGGKVTNFLGKKWEIKRTDLLATNGRIHSKMIKLLTSF